MENTEFNDEMNPVKGVEVEGGYRQGYSDNGELRLQYSWPIKTMTDEQIKTLQKQIVAYSVISEHLRQLYCAATFTNATSPSFHDNNNHINDVSNGVPIHGNPGLTVDGGGGGGGSGGGGSRIRSRWGPTAEQLKILESNFSEKNNRPSKEKISELTVELAKHGEITWQNVYNWFQNRRARMKNKQVAVDVHGDRRHHHRHEEKGAEDSNGGGRKVNGSVVGECCHHREDKGAVDSINGGLKVNGVVGESPPSSGKVADHPTTPRDDDDGM